MKNTIPIIMVFVKNVINHAKPVLDLKKHNVQLVMKVIKKMIKVVVLLVVRLVNILIKENVLIVQQDVVHVFKKENVQLVKISFSSKRIHNV